MTTVRVRMVDTSCTLSIRAESFINPTVSGQDYLEVTDQCFLIEHGPSCSRVMFDLGVRKDYWNLPPVVLSRLCQGLAVRSLKVPNDVSEVLAASGIGLDQICMSPFTASMAKYDNVRLILLRSGRGMVSLPLGSYWQHVNVSVYDKISGGSGLQSQRESHARLAREFDVASTCGFICGTTVARDRFCRK